MIKNPSKVLEPIVSILLAFLTGSLVLILIGEQPFEIFKKEITLRSSYINPYTFPAAVSLIESGRLDVTSMIYEKAPLSELPAILADPRRRSAGKYVITM